MPCSDIESLKDCILNIQNMWQLKGIRPDGTLPEHPCELEFNGANWPEELLYALLCKIAAGNAESLEATNSILTEILTELQGQPQVEVGNYTLLCSSADVNAYYLLYFELDEETGVSTRKYLVMPAGTEVTGVPADAVECPDTKVLANCYVRVNEPDTDDEYYTQVICLKGSTNVGVVWVDGDGNVTATRPANVTPCEGETADFELLEACLSFELGGTIQQQTVSVHLDKNLTAAVKALNPLGEYVDFVPPVGATNISYEIGQCSLTSKIELVCMCDDVNSDGSQINQYIALVEIFSNGDTQPLADKTLDLLADYTPINPIHCSEIGLGAISPDAILPVCIVYTAGGVEVTQQAYYHILADNTVGVFTVNPVNGQYVPFAIPTGATGVRYSGGLCPTTVVPESKEIQARRVVLSNGVWTIPANTNGVTIAIRRVGDANNPPTVTDHSGNVTPLFRGMTEVWNAEDCNTVIPTFTVTSTNANDQLIILWTER
jgi:hypothetical protein